MNSLIAKLALGFVVLGTLFLVARALFSSGDPRLESLKVPIVLKCDECGELFTYDKRKWAAREFSPSEWKHEYRNRNDCLKCGAPWAAVIIGEGKLNDFEKLEPPPETPEPPRPVKK